LSDSEKTLISMKIKASKQTILAWQLLKYIVIGLCGLAVLGSCQVEVCRKEKPGYTWQQCLVPALRGQK
jgi:hypothetical protein